MQFEADMERRRAEESKRRVQYEKETEDRKMQEKARREAFDAEQQKVRYDRIFLLKFFKDSRKTTREGSHVSTSFFLFLFVSFGNQV